MLSLVVGAIKVIFLLGILIIIHEFAHFIVAKLCKVKVNEFSIGFGAKLFQKQGKETKYVIRLIPLGGFVSMEGETEKSEEEGSFSKASIFKRTIIVLAGGVVNILFGVIICFFILGFSQTFYLIQIMFESLKTLFTGQISVDQLMGPIGISEVVVETNSFLHYLYLIAVISISLGITNLLPFPPLDGGKVVLIILEAVRRKPLKQEIEVSIQMFGFILLICLSIYVAYNDVIRIS